MAACCLGPSHGRDATRLLTYENGVAVWEGKPIGKDDPFPDR